MERLKPLERWFKSLFFRLSRSMIRKGRTVDEPLDGNTLQKVLFLRPEKLGDMIISLPVFDGLKNRYPHIKISVLGSPRNQAVIKDDPRFERVFLYRKNIFRDIVELLAIRRQKFDCVVDMICDDSVTALILAQWCAPGKPRIGVGKTEHRRYYDFNYHHLKGASGHVIDGTLKLLNAFGIDTDNVEGYAKPYINPSSMQMAEGYFDKLFNGRPSGLRIGFNLSAGAPNRVWALDKSKKLVDMILSRHEDYSVILISTPAERERSDEVSRAFNQRVYQIPPNLNFMQASALVSHLDVLITPDTSFVHVARAFQVPVVGLYSSCDWNFLFWKPYGQEVGAVLSGNDHNIYDITPEQVFDSFEEVVRIMLTERT